jgi:hypothetical protein
MPRKSGLPDNSETLGACDPTAEQPQSTQQQLFRASAEKSPPDAIEFRSPFSSLLFDIVLNRSPSSIPDEDISVEQAQEQTFDRLLND